MSSFKKTARNYVARAAGHLMAASGDQVAKLFLCGGDPWPVYDRIREQGPVYRSRIGYSAVSSHELCTRVLRGPDFGFRDSTGTLNEYQRLPLGLAPSLLELDPPEHGRLRRVVAPAFRAKQLAGYRPRIEQTAHRLLDRIGRTDEPFDIIADFAAPLPMKMICDLLGVPDDQYDEVSRCGTLTAQALDGPLPGRTATELAAAVTSLNELFTELADKRRGERGSDVITVLVEAADQGQMSADELLATCHLLLIAGFVTTVNLIGNGVFQFARHPDAWASLRENPELAGRAVEEVLRFDPPIPVTTRVCNTEAILAGQRIPANSSVLTMLASANRDPEVYIDPHTFDITRTDTPEHFAFAGGIHYCLGAQLARIEGEVALRALSERLPRIRLIGTPRLRPSKSVRGFLSLPITA
ncbi:cytochrome P450 [Amycolatopsis sp. A1MSW2902]|uniref:cytochrome P450 n=1 Tax=Amycolatopsis sp. A1MSW2902 TaxID=687413 RepID=UPI00307F8681